MKHKLFVIIAVMGLAMFSSNSLSAVEKGSHKGSMTDEDITANVTESGAIKVGNKICPLSHEEVGGMGEVVEVEHEGKIYNLCCAMCLLDFKKNPEKYIKMINEELAGESPGSGDN